MHSSIMNALITVEVNSGIRVGVRTGLRVGNLNCMQFFQRMP